MGFRTVILALLTLTLPVAYLESLIWDNFIRFVVFNLAEVTVFIIGYLIGYDLAKQS